MASDIDYSSLRKALALLDEALQFWAQEPEVSALKKHLRSAVIQSFEFSYELSVRLLRRTLIERAASAVDLVDASFNDLLRKAADAGLLKEPLIWRTWRELRNSTSHSYEESVALEVAVKSAEFLKDAQSLLHAMEQLHGR